MITDILVLIIGGFVQLVVFLFSAITFFIPTQFATAISEFVGHLRYAQGIMPIVPDPSMTGLASNTGIMTILGWALGFIAAWYTLKLVLFTFSIIPWLGRHIHLPHSGGRRTEKELE